MDGCVFSIDLFLTFGVCFPWEISIRIPYRRIKFSYEETKQLGLPQDDLNGREGMQCRSNVLQGDPG